MYKIYINETPLFLLKTSELLNFPINKDRSLVTRYSGKAKMLLNYSDMLEKSQRFEALILHTTDYEKLIKDFNGVYKTIEAAGGLVFNAKKEVLMIHRLGFWDLPKGKIEKNESKEEAAIREVQEETGLNEVTLGELIHTTYHTYRTKKDKRILKRSYWYNMHTKESNLTPQTEEAIDQAIWVDPISFFKTSRKVYKNIIDVLKKGHVLK